MCCSAGAELNYVEDPQQINFRSCLTARSEGRKETVALMWLWINPQKSKLMFSLLSPAVIMWYTIYASSTWDHSVTLCNHFMLTCVFNHLKLFISVIFTFLPLSTCFSFPGFLPNCFLLVIFSHPQIWLTLPSLSSFHFLILRSFPWEFLRHGSG